MSITDGENRTNLGIRQVFGQDRVEFTVGTNGDPGHAPGAVAQGFGCQIFNRAAGEMAAAGNADGADDAAAGEHRLKD